MRLLPDRDPRTRRSLSRTGAFLAVLVAILGLSAAVAPLAASAARRAQTGPVLGTLTIDPRTGFDTTILSFVTPDGCPAPATNLFVYLSGHGLDPDNGGLVGNSSTSIYTSEGVNGYTVPAAESLADVGNAQSPPVTLSGKYDVVLDCIRAAGSTVYGRYVGTFTISERKFTVVGARATVASPVAKPSSAAPTHPAAGAPSSGQGSHQSAAPTVGSPSPGAAHGSASAGAPTPEALGGASATASPNESPSAAAPAALAPHSGSGTPAWVIVLIILAALWLVAGVFAALRHRRSPPSPSP